MFERPIKILIVDDEEDLLIDTKDILEHKGFVVFTALESDAALDIFRKESPQIYILDVHMPFSKLDGNGILAEIRKLDKLAYCIMLSRIDEKDRVEEARRLGANRYALKLITFPELMELIDEAVKTLESRGESQG